MPAIKLNFDIFFMKHQIPYKNFPNFILRTPLFPIDFLKPFTQKRITPIKQLKSLCSIPIIKEALFLASPDLYFEIQKWLKDEITNKKESEKIQYAVMRYLLRMSTRSTPFGLFAGFSIGSVEEKTKIELLNQMFYKRHTRLDMNYLCALAQDIARHKDIKDKIKYFPNSSIYTIGDQIRYVEYKYINSKRIHHIVAVDNSEYLQKVLSKASDGAYLKTLAELLTDEEISFEEAREFIEELIDSQLLVNELEPAITGSEFIDKVISVIENLNNKNLPENIFQVIKQTKNELIEIDNNKIGTTITNYNKIADSLKTLDTKYELKFLFQTDMVKPALNCTLDKAVVNDVLSGISVLNKLSIAPSKTNLTQFRDSFFERYKQKEVPLLEALDTEVGVGYLQNISGGDISPLVDDLNLPPQPNFATDIKWSKINSFLNNKYIDAITNQKDEIEITDKELQDFEEKWDDLPNTFSTMIRLLNNTKSGNQKGKIYISSVGGSSAANLLGRFCHADESTFKYVKQITAKEEEINPEVIYAEIIHLPESRTGNILLRPVLRKFEIPYLAKSSAHGEFQIKPGDIMVSVRRNRIVLRSKKLDKKIIPRLSSAHNYSFNALPVYQFLCDLQAQGLRGGVFFGWGPLANEYKFLPRVVYKNLILSFAEWNIKKDDIQQFLKIKEDSKLYESFHKWRDTNKIPVEVALSDSDNELYLNLENILCIKTLLSLVKNRQNFKLTEFLFDRDNAVVKGVEGSFTNEVVISFYKIPDSPQGNIN